MAVLFRFIVFSLVFGCAAFDDGLNAVGDALKGDFRSLAKSKETTLSKICDELAQNQVTGSKKLLQSMLTVPVIITTVSGEYGDISGFHVAFRDYYKTAHYGHAWTRSANLSNQNKVTALKAGDRIKVTGILDMKLSAISPRQCKISLDKANFKKIQ